MTEEQFDALVELIRTIVEETFWKQTTDSCFCDPDRERKMIAKAKKELVQPQKLRQMLISHRRRDGSQLRGE